MTTPSPTARGRAATRAIPPAAMVATMSNMTVAVGSLSFGCSVLFYPFCTKKMICQLNLTVLRVDVGIADACGEPPAGAGAARAPRGAARAARARA